MFQYVIRRLLLMIPTFMGITFLVFFILQVAPDGPFERAVKQLKNANAQSESGVNMSSDVTGDSSELTPEWLYIEIKQQHNFQKRNSLLSTLRYSLAVGSLKMDFVLVPALVSKDNINKTFLIWCSN